MSKVKIVISGKVNYDHEISSFLAAKVIALIELNEPKEEGDEDG